VRRHIGIIFADSESAVSNALILPFPQACQARRLTDVRPPGERIVNRLGDADRAGVGRARSLIESAGSQGSGSLGRSRIDVPLHASGAGEDRGNAYARTGFMCPEHLGFRPAADRLLVSIEWGVPVRGIENSKGNPFNVTFLSSHIGNIFRHGGYPYDGWLLVIVRGRWLGLYI
jgi:hypothetical protein